MYSLTGDHGSSRFLQLQTYLEFLMELQYNLCVVKAQGFVIASRACSLTNARRGTLKKSLGRDVPPRPLLRHKLCISPPCSLFGTTNVDPSPGDPSSPTFKLFYTCKGFRSKKTDFFQRVKSQLVTLQANPMFTNIFPHQQTT